MLILERIVYNQPIRIGLMLDNQWNTFIVFKFENSQWDVLQIRSIMHEGNTHIFHEDLLSQRRVYNSLFKTFTSHLMEINRQHMLVRWTMGEHKVTLLKHD